MWRFSCLTPCVDWRLDALDGMTVSVGRETDSSAVGSDPKPGLRDEMRNVRHALRKRSHQARLGGHIRHDTRDLPLRDSRLRLPAGTEQLRLAAENTHRPIPHTRMQLGRGTFGPTEITSSPSTHSQ